MKITNIIILIIGIAGLIGIRIAEDDIFYDPFLNYFHEASTKAKFPKFDWSQLILSHFFRFVLNLLFSAIVIQAVFRNSTWTKQGVILMTLVFAITFPIYLYCLSTEFSVGNLFTFYIRRFVIQPLVLLLIIPLFYYRKHLETKS